MVSFNYYEMIKEVLNPPKKTFDVLLTLSPKIFCKAAEELGKNLKKSPSNCALKFEDLHVSLNKWIHWLNKYLDDIGPEQDRLNFPVFKLGRYMRKRKLIDSSGSTENLKKDLKMCLNDVFDNAVDPEKHKLSKKSENYLHTKETIDENYIRELVMDFENSPYFE